MDDLEKKYAPPRALAVSDEHAENDEILFEWLQAIRSELKGIRSELQSSKAFRLTVTDGMNIALGFILMSILASMVGAVFWFVLLARLLGR